MKPIGDFLIEPFGNKRYDATRMFGDVEFVMNVSQEDYLTTNRKAKVLALPFGYNGDVKVGDELIVHHNVFRKFYNMHGEEVDGFNHLIDNKYLVGTDQAYLYRPKGESWKAIDDFVFVKPNVDADNCFNGKVVYTNNKLISKGINSGDSVVFGSFCHHRFNIEGEVLFKMTTNSIYLKE